MVIRERVRLMENNEIDKRWWKMSTQSVDGFWIPSHCYTKFVQFIRRSRSTTIKERDLRRIRMKMGKLLWKRKWNWENLVTKAARVLIPIPIPFIMPFFLLKKELMIEMFFSVNLSQHPTIFFNNLLMFVFILMTLNYFHISYQIIIIIINQLQLLKDF